jgi:hypothetical protein
MTGGGRPPAQYAQPVGVNAPVFSVQIRASKSKLSNVAFTFSTLSLNGERIAEEYYPNDLNGYPFKYVVGEFAALDDAIRYCKYINDQNIISGAFVVAYYNEKRILIRQAIEILERLKRY